jgi:hypothetical protein
MVPCRWQHQTNESVTNAIPCPSVDAAAAAAAAVITSSTQPQQGASTAHPVSATAAAAGAQAPDSLLWQEPSAPATGPALSALLSILKWADGLCGTRAAATGHHKRSSGGGDGIGSQQLGPALSFNVVLDERQHGTQSLLHSGLSRLQGEGLGQSSDDRADRSGSVTGTQGGTLHLESPQCFGTAT